MNSSDQYSATVAYHGVIKSCLLALPSIKWCSCVYVYMNWIIGKGPKDQKRPYWGENRLKSKSKGKYKYLVIFWKLAAPIPMLLQVVNGSNTCMHVKLFLLLRVLLVCWSLSDDLLLIPGLQDNLSCFEVRLVVNDLVCRDQFVSYPFFSWDCNLSAFSLSS